MTRQESCLCAKRSLRFNSDFDGEVVTKIYCPDCVGRAPDEAIVFDLCEPSEYAGTWGVHYNAGELKRLDPAFRDRDDYYLSLLISGVCGPEIARSYGKAGLCRIFGFKGRSPDEAGAGATLGGKEEVIATEEMPGRLPGDVVSGPGESPRRSRSRRK